MKNYFSKLIVSVFVLAVLASCQSAPKNNSEKEINSERKLTHVDWSRDAAIYELNVRQYSEEGTFKAVEADLERIKELGIDIIWVMPIHPIGVENRKGTLGSYYSVKDYYGVNPEFGTMQDFKDFVAKAQELGMKVIIDWVANHTAWDITWVNDHPEWYAKDSTGNMFAPFGWSDVVQLNYDNKDLRTEMIKALKFWVEEANIDGYRCDVASMVPTDFWEDAREHLDAIKPVFMLAEAEEPELNNYAFNMSYAWSFHHVMNEIGKGNKDASDIMPALNEMKERFPEDTYMMHFTTNHDENSWNGTVFERLGDGYEAFAVLASTIPGMPLVYSGQEAGMDHRLEFFEKDQINWKEHKIFNVYKTLFDLKERNAALRNGTEGGEIIQISTDRPEKVFAFSRANGDDEVVVIINLSVEELNVTLQLDGAKEMNNVFTSELVNLSSEDKVELGAWEYIVLEK